MTTKQFTLPGIPVAPSIADVDPADLIASPTSDMCDQSCALVLLRAVLTIEAGHPPSRGYLLDSYQECLRAVNGDHGIGDPTSGYIN
jgi:hypothetical protein